MIHGNWICPSRDIGDICPIFKKTFTCKAGVKAQLSITALGIAGAYRWGAYRTYP
ncbi:MAG: hypothetical protein IKV90_06175 [Clostridia bacterium]|nr:hypothetical protein [Clostridia bacterium]